MTNEPYGQHWNLPTCKLCGEKIHQIFCFDLKDDGLRELRGGNLGKLPLVSCLNCSMVWEQQIF